MSFHGNWFFNTDESEQPGRGAYKRMISESCVAAWGDCRGKGAEELLKGPSAGERVFLFRVGFGMVATGLFDNQEPYSCNTVFNEKGEYHRTVTDLLVLPETNILSFDIILQNTGYNLPVRQILCRIHDDIAAKFMEDYFRNNAIKGKERMTAQQKNQGDRE